jgi:hypothetical protein
MKKYINLSLFFLLISLFSLASANDSSKLDSRNSLDLNPSEKAAFLSEMREMLSSIQKIMMGIGTENREMIIDAARYSGNRMARNTPESIKQKTPQAFKELGGPTHMMFEELVIRADVDDMGTLATFTGELMQKCVACHALFKTN